MPERSGRGRVGVELKGYGLISFDGQGSDLDRRTGFRVWVGVCWYCLYERGLLIMGYGKGW